MQKELKNWKDLRQKREIKGNNKGNIEKKVEKNGFGIRTSFDIMQKN